MGNPQHMDLIDSEDCITETLKLITLHKVWPYYPSQIFAALDIRTIMQYKICVS